MAISCHDLKRGTFKMCWTTYTSISNQDFRQRSIVTRCLPPHRVDGVDWGARDTRCPRQNGCKPWGMESVRRRHGDDKKLRYCKPKFPSSNKYKAELISMTIWQSDQD